MPGARIALYEKLGDGSYRLREMLTTDDMGIALFTELDQKTEYVAVEYDIPRPGPVCLSGAVKRKNVSCLGFSPSPTGNP